MASILTATIPLNSVNKVELYINKSRKSLAQIKKETGADYILNGTLYNMSKWSLCCHAKVGGGILCKPDYNVYGYAWNEGSDMSLELLPDSKDDNYVACACLVRNSKATTLHYDSAMGGKRGRSAIGTKDGNLYLFCSKDGSANAKTPEALQKHCLELGLTDAVMLDGGGSSQCDFNGEKITSSRNVHNLILVYLKKSQNTDSEEEIKMSNTMKVTEFVDKLKDIANNYKTLYVMGCFGAPLTASNKTRYCNNHAYNKDASRTKLIKAASTDTFGFDCCGLIKGVLWGWNGNKSKTYGGATYTKNGVPDIGADAMIKVCTGVSTNFAKVEVGELLWCKGHIGVYIGDGLAIESTPSWKNKVQITAVKNIGTKSGYNARTWTKHGKFPYIDYTGGNTSKPVTSTTTKPATSTAKVKIDAAHKFDKSLAGRYKVTATELNIRSGASTSKTSLGVLSKNTVVSNYGYYNTASNGVKWLYVQLADGTLGYCSSNYLKKC